MKLTTAKSLVASALLALAASGAALAASDAHVDVKQGAALQSQGALLLDVREEDEYAEGHAPGSTLIPLGQLPQRLQEISGYKDKQVAVICRSGSRSAKALKTLQQAGFSTAVNVDGGMIAWQKAGLPVISGASAR